MNIGLIKKLNELVSIYAILGETYREKAFERAVEAISTLKYEIDASNAPNLTDRKIKYIGKAISDVINEYLQTGEISDIEKAKKTPTYIAYEELIKIMGVGPMTIKRWIEIKILSVADLRAAVERGTVKLNDMQQYGLRYYNDLQQRIPRDEVTVISAIIEKYLRALDFEGLRFEICGSYRRGLASSGDIDIIISQKLETDILVKFETVLRGDAHCVAIVSKGSQRVTFLYKSDLSGLVRQVDILYVKEASYIPAVLYFTGSASFNIMMRSIAKEKGLRLNQLGIYKQTNLGKPLLFEFESEIFDMLGMAYVPPTSR